MGLGTSNSFCCPTRFIAIASALDRISLVVEPSPEFPHRSLAADDPLYHLHHFHTITPTVSSYVVVDEALGSSSNSPSYTLARYQTRRPQNQINEEVVTLLEAFDSIEPTLLVMLVQELNSSFGSSFLSPSCEHLLSQMTRLYLHPLAF
jgi:hypothetical protein